MVCNPTPVKLYFLELLACLFICVLLSSISIISIDVTHVFNYRWVEGDALDLPFSDCYADAITIGYGLRNMVDRHKAMKEMYRVLKPGAKLSILDFNKSANPFSSLILVLVH